MLKIAKEAKSVLIIDHHETAESQLKGIDKEADNIICVFDMNRSGAGLAWDYLFEDKPRPVLISHIEDRDLWRFEFNGTKEIHMHCDSYPISYEQFCVHMQTSILHMKHIGGYILNYQTKLVDDIVKNHFHARLTDEPFPSKAVYCSSKKLTSDVGNKLLESESPIRTVTNYVVIITQKQNGRYYYSLRSKGETNVAKIAERFGGGGHKNAAAFSSKLICHEMV